MPNARTPFEDPRYSPGPEADAVRWLASHGMGDVRGRLEADLATLCERRGVENVVRSFEQLARNPENVTPAQYVYGSDRALNAIQTGRSAKPETDQERETRELHDKLEAARARRLAAEASA